MWIRILKRSKKDCHEREKKNIRLTGKGLEEERKLNKE